MYGAPVTKMETLSSTMQKLHSGVAEENYYLFSGLRRYSSIAVPSAGTDRIGNDHIDDRQNVATSVVTVFRVLKNFAYVVLSLLSISRGPSALD